MDGTKERAKAPSSPTAKAPDRRVRAAAAVLVGLLVVSGAAFLPSASAGHSPDPDTNYFSRINPTQRDPTDLSVVVVPAAYLSSSAMVGDTGWIGPNALHEQPGTQAALEAIDYWAWAVDLFETEHPQLAHVAWTTRVVGHDATPGDVQEADIVVTTAMANDPVPLFLFHAGLGLPTVPPRGLLYPDGPVDRCTVWNTGVGAPAADQDPFRLRNLVLHEFGHCLGVGHTGESVGGEICNGEGVCYDEVPGDVMNAVHGAERQCISNLNVQSLAEGYAWLPGHWQGHDDETYMQKADYERTCMPAALERV